MRAAEQHAKAQAVGQVDMFGVLTEEIDDVKKAFANVPHWPDKVWLEGARDPRALPHRSPHQPVQQRAAALHLGPTVRSASHLPGYGDHGGGVGDRGAQHGDQARQQDGDLHLDDRSGRLDVTLFSEALEKYEELMQKDRILVSGFWTGQL